MLRVDDIAEDSIVFYDIETDSQFAPYAQLKMIGVQYGLRGQPELVESWGERKRFKAALADPERIKVQFNGLNFDDLVLWRFGYPVDEHNRHDIFLMAKTVAPRLPSYSLKFISWYYFGDRHLPEMEILAWLKKNGKESLWQSPKELLRPYCLYDVTQTRRLFCLFWEIVQRPLHWTAYTQVELPMGLPLEEIMLRGGEYLDERRIDQLIATLQDEKLGWEDYVWRLTDGKINNPNSVKQVGTYLRDEDGIELELTDKGNFSLKKADVLDFLDLDNPDRDRSKIIRGLFEVRRINNTLSYYRNYLSALQDNPVHWKAGWIPKQYSLSGARTRRILSNSKYHLNFQNPNEAAKEVQVVPAGWLGFWIDATQVENVVHIYESGDSDRRAAYEADENWNEYVWLANTALGDYRTKEELDSIPSPFNPSWTIYKQFKTTKLALNFGMGVTKYSRTAKLPERAGQASFRQVLSACPAIKNLQRRVAQDLTQQGYVQDVFGHIYTGDTRQAYKVVAYLIQGCGTGSLPKKQMRALYDILHQWDFPIGEIKGYWTVVDEQRGMGSYGVLCGTTHDEIQGRISLALDEDEIVATLQQMMEAMTTQFSHHFDGIPLRAKLYLSTTTTNDRIEVDIRNIEEIKEMICQSSLVEK